MRLEALHPARIDVGLRPRELTQLEVRERTVAVGVAVPVETDRLGEVVSDTWLCRWHRFQTYCYSGDIAINQKGCDLVDAGITGDRNRIRGHEH